MDVWMPVHVLVIVGRHRIGSTRTTHPKASKNGNARYARITAATLTCNHYVMCVLGGKGRGHGDVTQTSFEARA